MHKPAAKTKTTSTHAPRNTSLSRRALLGRTAAATAGLFLAANQSAFAATAKKSTGVASPSKGVIAALAKARIRVGAVAYTPQGFVDQMSRSLPETTKLIDKGVRIETTPAAIAYLQTVGSPTWLSGEGEVTTSAVTGVEELVVAFLVGVLVGAVGTYLAMSGDDAETTTEGEDEGEDQGHAGETGEGGGDTGGSGDTGGGSGDGGGSGG